MELNEILSDMPIARSGSIRKRNKFLMKLFFCVIFAVSIQSYVVRFVQTEALVASYSSMFNINLISGVNGKEYRRKWDERVTARHNFIG